MFIPREPAWFLEQVGLQPTPPIPPLERLPYADFEPSLPSNHDAARALLIQQRVSAADYKSPSQQKRNLFRTKKQKESVCNVINWIFTKHEVASAFDCLLCTAPLAPVGVAQALLAQAPEISLDELWCHFKDAKLEKTMKARKGKMPEAPVIAAPWGEITWLDKVTTLNNSDYIQLLCQNHLPQEALDRAFGIALRKHSLDAMRVLLSFGAVAWTNMDIITEHVKNDNVALVNLLLSAPSSVDTPVWRTCLDQFISTPNFLRPHSLTILLNCLTTRPAIFSEPLLLGALRAQNLESLAILLAYGAPRESIPEMKHRASPLACNVLHPDRRLSFFKLLAPARLLGDNEALRQELVKDIAAGHLELAKILVEAPVHVDEAVNLAISQLNFPALEILRYGVFTRAVSLSLIHLPVSATEEQLVRLMGVLSPLGVTGSLLDSQLVRAVRLKQSRLIQSLLSAGASVEFEGASAVKAALEHPDFEILDTLLKYKCSPKTLSKVIPTAMKLVSRPVRMKAMQALMEKGMETSALGVALRELVSREIDADLIQLLLKHKAPVDGISDPKSNPVLVIAWRGHLQALRMLCDAGPLKQTLDAAVPIAFRALPRVDYDVVADSIKLLIEKGANGSMLDRTLRDAALTDVRLDIVRILLDGGANADFEDGAAFVRAIHSGNLRLLEMLCTKSVPNYKTLQIAIPMAVEMKYFNTKGIELLLNCPGAAWVLASLWKLDTFIFHAKRSEIIPLFLQYGLSVNADGGSVLQIAIRDKNMDLIKTILSLSPNTASLKAGFQLAAGMQPKDVRLQITRLLLESSSSAEIGQSRHLVWETTQALTGDLDGLKLLLSHNATVEEDGGEALMKAASAGSSAVLEMLLSTKPSDPIVEKAFFAVSLSTLPIKRRLEMYTYLLHVGDAIKPETMSKVLADHLEAHPEDLSVPELFLDRGVKVTFKTLKAALESSPDVFEMLTKRLHNPITANKTFKHARKVLKTSEKRYWAYQCLNKKGVSKEELSQAVLDSLKDDANSLKTIELLVDQGADTGYKKGKAFTMAFKAKQYHIVGYLARKLNEGCDEEAANVAFDLARKTTTYDPNERLAIYESLCRFTLKEDLLYQALAELLYDGQRHISTVRLLLEKGADPNQGNAQCFVSAYGKGSKVVFQTLAKYADFQVVIPALLKSIHAEDDAVRCIRTCLKEQPKGTVILPDEVLFDCLRKFPGGTRLLKVLLDLGVSPSATMEYALHKDWKPEQCTALIWALASQPKVTNDVLLYLLEQGEAGKSHPNTRASPMLTKATELGAYATARKKVTAIFCCLMDKNRTPVLRALLNIDSPEILESVISGSTFSALATPSVNQTKQEFDALFDDADDISPVEACLFLGNFQAFRLMQCGENPDDGTLHLASLLALPDFVKYLLGEHDPSYAAEDFGFMIPLGLACCSKPFPWCKVANEEKAWEKRLKETMKLLIPKSEFDWRHRERLTLHIALENGLEVTKAFVEALGGIVDSKTDHKYVYIDKTGMQYSPVDYVEAFLEGEGKEKEALVRYLNEQNVC